MKNTETFNEKNFSIQRKKELEAAFKKDAPWGARIQFLDTINSVDELEELIPSLEDLNRQDSELIDDDDISFYRKNLTRWPNPTLEDSFKKDFPLVAARLDTPQKVRIFLRGTEARGVDVSTMASVFEDIIKKHEVDGLKVVRYEQCRGNSWRDALRIVYHTQLQYWTLTKLMLPGHTSCGTSKNGLFIDWRSEEERRAAGES